MSILHQHCCWLLTMLLAWCAWPTVALDLSMCCKYARMKSYTKDGDDQLELVHRLDMMSSACPVRMRFGLH